MPHCPSLTSLCYDSCPSLMSPVLWLISHSGLTHQLTSLPLIPPPSPCPSTLLSTYPLAHLCEDPPTYRLTSVRTLPHTTYRHWKSSHDLLAAVAAVLARSLPHHPGPRSTTWRVTRSSCSAAATSSQAVLTVCALWCGCVGGGGTSTHVCVWGGEGVHSTYSSLPACYCLLLPSCQACRAFLLVRHYPCPCRLAPTPTTNLPPLPCPPPSAPQWSSAAWASTGAMTCR